MKIKTILLAACAAFALSTTVSAAISITISPISGDTDNYLLQASGTGNPTSGAESTGTLGLTGIAFLTANGAPAAGLSFGGESVTAASRGSTKSNYDFALANTLPSGAAYSFSGGSTTVPLSSTYADTFVPGVYSIGGSNGIFSSGVTGTFTILATPIPEPGTYAALGGLAALGLVMIRRRRKA